MCCQWQTLLTSVCRGVSLDEIGLGSDRIGLSSATNLNSLLAMIRALYMCGGPMAKGSILTFLYSCTHRPHLCDGMSWYPIQHTVTPNIDLRHYDSPAICSWHLSTTFVTRHGRALRNHFSTGKCLATHRKSVIGLWRPNYFSSLVYSIIRFVTIWAYLSFLWAARWKTNKFGQIRGLFTSIAEWAAA